MVGRSAPCIKSHTAACHRLPPSSILQGRKAVLAAASGDANILRELIRRGANLDCVAFEATDIPGHTTPQHVAEGDTALIACCRAGHADCARLLLQSRANPNFVTMTETSALQTACEGAGLEEGAGLSSSHRACIEALFQAGRLDHNVVQAALVRAAFEDKLQLLQELCSYGNTYGNQAGTMLSALANRLPARIADWLGASANLSTPIQYLEVITSERARMILRGERREDLAIFRYDPRICVDLHAPFPSPVSLANDLQRAGRVPAGSTADLVLRAAQPWSIATHALFPQPAREWAWALFKLGVLISQQTWLASSAILDVWLSEILPRTIRRDTRPMTVRTHSAETGRTSIVAARGDLSYALFRKNTKGERERKRERAQGGSSSVVRVQCPWPDCKKRRDFTAEGLQSHLQAVHAPLRDTVYAPLRGQHKKVCTTSGDARASSGRPLCRWGQLCRSAKAKHWRSFDHSPSYSILERALLAPAVGQPESRSRPSFTMAQHREATPLEGAQREGAQREVLPVIPGDVPGNFLLGDGSLQLAVTLLAHVASLGGCSTLHECVQAVQVAHGDLSDAMEILTR